jgi:hypothetical protein
MRGKAKDVFGYVYFRMNVMTNRNRGIYFSDTSVLLLFLSIAAFYDKLFTDICQDSNSDSWQITKGE